MAYGKKLRQKTFWASSPEELDVMCNDFRNLQLVTGSNFLCLKTDSGMLFLGVLFYEV